jgi:hypothetical protein
LSLLVADYADIKEEKKKLKTRLIWKYTDHVSDTF